MERAYTLQQAYIKKERELIDGARETEKAQRFAKSREKGLKSWSLSKGLSPAKP